MGRVPWPSRASGPGHRRPFPIALTATCALLTATTAFAAPLTLTGNYLQVGISDYGTFGSNGSTEPGLLHDPKGLRNFYPNGIANDYLTPGTPHDGFAINSTQTGLIINDNDGTSNFGMASPTLLTGAAAQGYSNAASWTSTSGTSLSITNRYFFNNGDERIKVVSTITALTALTNLAFGRSEDPDPDVNAYGTYDTINTRGDATTAPQDLVSAAGASTGLTLGILNGSGDTYGHNTAISTDCCTNADPYTVIANTDTLAYPTTNSGDYGLQIAWQLGDLAVGQSLSVTYDYVFGTSQSSVSTGGSSPTIDTTNGDISPSVFSLGSAAATASTVVFDGGTLQISGGTFANNIVAAPVIVDANNGTIDTSTGNGGFSGSVSGPGSLTIIGGGTFSLTAANTYAGGTVVQASTVAVGSDTALGTGVLTMNDGALRVLADGLSIGNAATITGGNTINTNGFGLTYAGNISGTGGLQKLGTSTLVLTGTNTYTGGTIVSAGTLQLGNGGTAGSVAGNITDNAALLFNRADAVTYGGVISGSGAVTQGGAGTLTFTGANSYTGTTTISPGTILALAGQGSIGGSALSNAGTFDISQSGGASLSSLGGPGAVTLGSQTLTLTAASGTFGGAIGGGGRLVLQAGTEVLTGTNTYTGGTVITGGTLQIGNGGTTGSIAGRVADAGTLAFDRSDAVTFDGMISGAGTLAKAGAGTLTLTGPNSYGGGTLLQQGTLAIGAPTAIGTGRLAMDAGTTLRLTSDLTLANAIRFTGLADPTIDTGANTDTLSGPIDGTGALTKTGSGTLILTGQDPYTGQTTVAAGTLEVDGSIASSATFVGNGATLSGTGTIGSFTARSGSTVAPGNAVNPYGVLHTAGSAVFFAGSTYGVAISPTGQTSSLAVNGTATLGGADVTVASAAGTYTAATRYTILTAAGGVQGTFGTLSTAYTLAFLNPYLSYDANAVTLAFRTNGTTFGDIALTPNQLSVAAALQSIDPNSTLIRSLQGLSPDQARLALDALAGAAHASAATTAAQDSRRVATQILDRLWNIGGGEIDARTLLQQLAPAGELPAFVSCYAPVPPAPRSPPPSVVTAWGEGFGDFGHDGGDRNGAGLDRSLGGFIIGYDAPLHGLGAPYRIGIAGGYTNTSFTGSGSAGSGSTGTFESVFGSLYGGARYGAVDIRAGVTVAGTSTTVDRTVAYPGVSESEHAVNGGNTEQLFGELGYRFSGTRWVVEPIVNAAYTHVHQDDFHERGGAAALFGFAQDDDVGTTTLGARAEYAPFVGLPLVGRAFLGWRHGFGDINPATKLAFEAGSIPFTAQGAAIDRDALASELGVDWRTSGAMTLGVAYTGQVGQRDSDNGVKGRVEYKF